MEINAFAVDGVDLALGICVEARCLGCCAMFPAAGAARALGIEPVCERASAKHIGDSPTRSRRQAARVAPKKQLQTQN
jgi:hypothetical protein